jgi:hypothetical protein
MMLGVRRVMKIAVWIKIVIHTRTITIAIVKAMTTIMVVTAIAMGVIGKLYTIITKVSHPLKH